MSHRVKRTPVIRAHQGILNARDWGCRDNADPTTASQGFDNATPLAIIRAYLAGLRTAGKAMPHVIFPKSDGGTGIYETSSWPDFTFAHFKMGGSGGVTLRYVGSSTTYAFDFAGAAAPNANQVLRMELHDLRFESINTATNLLRFKNMYWSVLSSIEGRNGDSTGGARFVFDDNTLLAVYDLVGSSVWAGGETPQYGVKTQNAAAAIYFYNPIIEQSGGDGFKFQTGAVLCGITGGTSESNGGAGVVIDDGANRIWTKDFDLEGNGTYDYDIAGDHINVFGGNAGTAAGSILRSTALGNRFVGGRVAKFSVESGAAKNTAKGVSLTQQTATQLLELNGLTPEDCLSSSNARINPPLIVWPASTIADDAIATYDVSPNAIQGGGTVYFSGDGSNSLFGSVTLLAETGSASIPTAGRLAASGVTVDYATAATAPVAPTDIATYTDGRWSIVASQDKKISLVNRSGGTRNVWPTWRPWY